jgi:hypothetical protein
MMEVGEGREDAPLSCRLVLPAAAPEAGWELEATELMLVCSLCRLGYY